MASVETLQLRGSLEGHNGWVTSLATSSQSPDTLVSGSRDKSVIVWKLTLDGESTGFAKRSLLGHSHIVEDVAVSPDGEYVLSASWDKSMRLWSLADGTSTRFVGHTGDVLSCNISADNNLIASASRDRTVRIWDVVGRELLSFGGQSGHQDWVSSAHFTPDAAPKVISVGHDKVVKVSNNRFWFLERGGFGMEVMLLHLLLPSASMRHLFPPRSLIHLQSIDRLDMIKSVLFLLKNDTNHFHRLGTSLRLSLLPTSSATRTTLTPPLLLRMDRSAPPLARRAISSSGTSRPLPTLTPSRVLMRSSTLPSRRAVSGLPLLLLLASRSTTCRSALFRRRFTSRLSLARSPPRSRSPGRRMDRSFTLVTLTTSSVSGRSCALLSKALSNLILIKSIRTKFINLLRAV